MDPTVAQILRSPRARRVADRVAAALDAEAERRAAFLEWVTPEHKAEFINGEVVMHSPVKHVHTQIAGRLFRLLADYTDDHDLGYVASEKAMVSLTRNDYEPDVCFWRREVASSFTPDQMRFPAPDLVCEVLSPSTREVDLGVKLDDYGAHGVAEYWVLDPDGGTLRQFVQDDDAEDGALVLARLSDSGEVRSVAVDGLVLPVAAFFGDEAFRAAR